MLKLTAPIYAGNIEIKGVADAVINTPSYSWIFIVIILIAFIAVVAILFIKGRKRQ
ncbi:MAG: hypothetical protein J7K61_03020 [Thermoplasmata archaeon]|nr:hypothetical protein [Thermoplasmata archaeon]